MKKVLYFLMIFSFLFTFSCKKKVELAPTPPPPQKISEAIFLINLSNSVDPKSLKAGDSLVIKINKDQVEHPSAPFAVVKLFKENYEYNELLVLLKKIPLTVVWVGEKGSHLLIEDYSDLLNNYNASENFLVLDPKPVYSISIADQKYWVGPGGKFWKVW